MRVPPDLVRTWSHEPGWLEALPELVSECADLWSLEPEDPIDTPHSLVVPAGDVVLKLNAPSHHEADTEADALERWAGQAAVQLHARDDVRRALLIERCVPGTPLWDAQVDEAQADVVAELLPRLQIPVDEGHPFTLLADQADLWAENVPRRYADAGRPYERSLLDTALDVY